MGFGNKEVNDGGLERGLRPLLWFGRVDKGGEGALILNSRPPAFTLEQRSLSKAPGLIRPAL